MVEPVPIQETQLLHHRPIMAAAAAVVGKTAEFTEQLLQVLLEFALLSIGVRNGTLCKN
jgi:hypothetical protein